MLCETLLPALPAAVDETTAAKVLAAVGGVEQESARLSGVANMSTQHLQLALRIKEVKT